MMYMSIELFHGEKWRIIADSGIHVSDKTLLSRVLRENGYARSVGVDLLANEYGKVITVEGAIRHAFIGIHIGRECNLMSAVCLRWKNDFLLHRMNACFLGGDGSWEYSLRVAVKKSLGKQTQIDVVGCVCTVETGDEVERMVWRPPALGWLGICQNGWLNIDPSFYQLELYPSLPDLLRRNSGVEIEAIGLNDICG